jgi:DNA-binding GntR family transcriptional regulator
MEAKHTLADGLRGKLVNAIIEGELPQGSKISEVELARRYGVSRGPLREAIRDLEGMRLVERRPHAGVSVISLGLEALMEIYTIRESLEGMAARLAATEMSDEEIADLKTLLGVHEAKVKDSDGRVYCHQQGDLDFHLQVIKGSHNVRLLRLMRDELYQPIMMYRRQSSRQPFRPARALEEHKRICDAIESRDPELAELLMRRHIQGSKEALKQSIEETES